MSKVLVGSTIPAFAMEHKHWKWWLSNSAELTNIAAEAEMVAAA